MNWRRILQMFYEEHARLEKRGEVSGFDRLEAYAILIFMEWLERNYAVPEPLDDNPA